MFSQFRLKTDKNVTQIEVTGQFTTLQTNHTFYHQMEATELKIFTFKLLTF